MVQNYLVLFTKSSAGLDGIHSIYYDQELDKFIARSVYQGEYLGFDQDKFIETIGVCENEDIIKIYFVDGINPIRVYNIAINDATKIPVVDYQAHPDRFDL